MGRLIIVDGIPLTSAELRPAFASLDTRRDRSTRRRVEELRAARLADPGDAAACRAYYAVAFLAYFADTAAFRRSRGDLCAGGPEALRNKSAHVDRYTIQSLGAWDWRPGLRAVTAPVLVIHGTRDFFPPSSAREWAAAFRDARLVLVERSGHFPYLEKPERFFVDVETFLRGGWPAGD